MTRRFNSVLRRGATTVLLTVGSLVCGCAQVISAQETATTEYTLTALNSELTSLQGKAVSPAGKQQISWALQSVSAIQSQWRLADTPVPLEYRQALLVNVNAVRKLSYTAPGPTYTALLDDVAKDLSVKADYATPPSGDPIKFRTTVTVNVRTLRGGTEEGGYFVRCNPRSGAAQRPALFLFSRQSSPTSRPLPPGNYLLWVESTDGKVLKTQDMDVGANGEESQTVDVPLP